MSIGHRMRLGESEAECEARIDEEREERAIEKMMPTLLATLKKYLRFEVLPLASGGHEIEVTLDYEEVTKFRIE